MSWNLYSKCSISMFSAIISCSYFKQMLYLTTLTFLRSIRNFLNFLLMKNEQNLFSISSDWLTFLQICHYFQCHSNSKLKKFFHSVLFHKSDAIHLHFLVKSSKLLYLWLRIIFDLNDSELRANRKQRFIEKINLFMKKDLLLTHRNQSQIIVE